MGMHRGRALAYALLALVFGGLSYAVGVGSLLGQRAEASVLEAASFTYDPPAPLSLISVPAVIVALLLIGAIALWAHGAGRALAVVIFPTIAIVTSQLLKQRVLERPGLFEFDAENTFPSGHMTVFTVVSAALIWAVPRVLQPTVALLGAILTGVAAWQLLEYGWHRPSDLIGALSLGVLVFACAALIRVRGSRTLPRAPGRVSFAVNRILGVLLALVGATLVAGGLALTVAAGWFTSAELMISGAQVAVIGASALASRAYLALSA